MSQKKLDDFYSRQPATSKNSHHQVENIIYNSPNMPHRAEEDMQIDLHEESKEKQQKNFNSIQNHHSGSKIQPNLRFPHHTRNLWNTRKPFLYSIASRQKCEVEHILQVIYRNILECRIMRDEQLDILVLSQYLNEFESPQILNLFALIASYALEVEFLFPQPIPILTRFHSAEITFSSQQIRCMLALMFYCLWPKQEKEFDLPNIYTFAKVFSEDPNHSISSKIEKIKCALNYFRRQEKIEPLNLSFKRIHVKQRINWRDLNFPLCDVELIRDKNCTEDYRDSLMIDFANKYIAGGSLGSGCVQEEIMFFKHVEPLVSVLFTEKMENDECVVIQGCQRFNKTSGFKSNFVFEEDFIENIFHDELRINHSFIVAIDAVDYVGRVREQFNIREINRELAKAYAGFNAVHSNIVGNVATGRWGCGAFAGDDELKFIIQWLACSASNKKMFYLLWETQSEGNIRTLINSVQSSFKVSQLYNALISLNKSDSVINELLIKLTQIS